MNSLTTVAIVCLLVFTSCGANSLPRERDSGELQERQDIISQIIQALITSIFSNLNIIPSNTPRPDCGKCDLSNVKLGGLVAALQDLGPALQKSTDLLGQLLQKILAKIQDLKQAIYDAIESIKNTIGPVLDKLSAAVANIDTCPALKELFKNLKLHLYDILNILQNQWFPLINQPDVGTTVTKLAQILQIALPDIFKLLRDLVYNLLQVLQVLRLCDLLGQTIWNLLDPSTNNPVYQLVYKLLGTLSDTAAQTFLTSLLQGLAGIVGIIPSPGSNPVSIITNLLCTIARLLGLPIPILTCPASG